MSAPPGIRTCHTHACRLSVEHFSVSKGCRISSTVRKTGRRVSPLSLLLTPCRIPRPTKHAHKKQWTNVCDRSQEANGWMQCRQRPTAYSPAYCCCFESVMTPRPLGAPVLNSPEYPPTSICDGKDISTKRPCRMTLEGDVIFGFTGSKSQPLLSIQDMRTERFTFLCSPLIPILIMAESRPISSLERQDALTERFNLR